MLYVLSKVRLTSETLVAVRTSADLRQKMVKHWIVSTELVHKGLLSSEVLYVLSKVRLTSETLVAVRTSADLRQKTVKHWIVSTEVHKDY